MSKIVFFLLIITTFCLSCATMHDIEKERLKGISVSTTYDYSWEDVYVAIKFALNNEGGVSNFFRDANCAFEYVKEEKRIWIKLNGLGMGAGIYFIPVSDSKTRVEFVRSGFTKLFFRNEEINLIIKISTYLLKSNQKAFSSWC